MKLDPSDLQSDEAQAYWRKILDLPPETPIFSDRAIRAKFWPKPNVAPDLIYDQSQAPRDIVQCLCGVVVIRSQEGKVDWSDGQPHECYPEIPESPPQPIVPSPPQTDKTSGWIV